MTPLPPNPFVSDSVVSLATDTAAASKRPLSGAAAGPISEPSMATGGARKRRRRPLLHEPRQPPPGFDDDHRFVLDEEKFWAEIEPVPLFLQWAG